MRNCFLTFLLLTGCASKWIKEGASEEEKSKAYTECLVMEGQARLPHYGLSASPFMKTCMHGKGWKLE